MDASGSCPLTMSITVKPAAHTAVKASISTPVRSRVFTRTAILMRSPSGTTSTSTAPIAIGWHRGTKSGVLLTAITAASCAAANTSPLGVELDLIASTTSTVVWTYPAAEAALTVRSFAVTSTMRMATIVWALPTIADRYRGRVLNRRPYVWLISALTLAVTASATTGCTSVEPHSANDGTITVFAAASLRHPFEELATVFERENPGTNVVLVVAGSPTLARQLIDGADADVFASADPSHLQRVQSAGLLVDSARDFATNRAQAVRSPGSTVRSINDFANSAYQVSLCASAVPCGRSGDALLAQLNIVTPDASREADVLAVANKVASGEADAGIVYESDVVQADGRLVPITSPVTEPVESTYQIGEMRNDRQSSLSASWIAMTLSPEGQSILRRAGFRPADSLASPSALATGTGAESG